MNAWSEILNRTAEGWATAMWRASWQGGLAILLVWIVCLVSHRIPAKVRCWLWRLAFLKLVIALVWVTPIDLPVLPPVPEATSQTTPIIPSMSARESGLLSPWNMKDISIVPSGMSASPALETEPRSASRWSFTTGLLCLWGLGLTLAAANLGRAAWRNWCLRRDSTTCAEGALNNDLRALCAKFGARREPELRLAQRIGSPALIGLFHPMILLPAGLKERRCTPEELRLVLAHELAHLRRRDLWWNALPLAGQLLFFFHPLVWLARREWRLTQEMAADEAVLLTLESPAATYGQTLVRVCEMISTSASRPSGLLSVGVVESARNLKSRLKAMKHFRPSSTRWLATLGAGLALLGVLSLIPWHLVAQTPRREPTPVATETLGATNSPEQEKSPEGKSGAEPVPVNADEIRVFRLRYGSPAQIAEAIKPNLPSKASVVTDARTSSLVVTASRKSLEQITALIQELDVPATDQNVRSANSGTLDFLHAKLRVAELELKLAQDKRQRLERLKDSHLIPNDGVEIGEAGLAVAKAEMELIGVRAEIQKTEVAIQQQESAAKASDKRHEFALRVFQSLQEQESAAKGGNGKSRLENAGGKPQISAIMAFPAHRGLQIEVKATPEGNDFMLIQILDEAAQPMFKKDTAELTPLGIVVFDIVASEIARSEPAWIIELEGHTEAGFKPMRENYGAWEFSSDLANAARKRLLSQGVKEQQIAKVSAFGGTKPLSLLKSNEPSKPDVAVKPEDPVNRRVSIVLRPAKRN